MITKNFAKDLLPLKHRATTNHPPSQVENVQLCISQTPVAVEPGYNDDDDDDDDWWRDDPDNARYADDDDDMMVCLMFGLPSSPRTLTVEMCLEIISVSTDGLRCPVHTSKTDPVQHSRCFSCGIRKADTPTQSLHCATTTITWLLFAFSFLSFYPIISHPLCKCNCWHCIAEIT